MTTRAIAPPHAYKTGSGIMGSSLVAPLDPDVKERKDRIGFIWTCWIFVVKLQTCSLSSLVEIFRFGVDCVHVVAANCKRDVAIQHY